MLRFNNWSATVKKNPSRKGTVIVASAEHLAALKREEAAEATARALTAAVKTWSEFSPSDEDDEYDSSSVWSGEHVKTEAQGELADRIHAAFNVTSGKVFLVESTFFDGTEATQEHYLTLEVQVGSHRKEFEPQWTKNCFIQMLEWLDAAAPKL